MKARWIRYFVIPLLTVSLVANTVQAQAQGSLRCEDLFAGAAVANPNFVQRWIQGPQFDQRLFEDSRAELRTLPLETLKNLLPKSPEEKLAWLEVLSERYSGNTFAGASLHLPEARGQRVALMKVLRKDALEFNFHKISKIVDTLYLEKNLYFQFVRELPQLQFDNSTNRYIQFRLESAARKQGMVKALKDVGIIESDRQLLKFQEALEKYKPDLQFALDSLLGMSALYAVKANGQLVGSVIPVWRSVQHKKLTSALVDKILNEGIDASLPAIREHFGIRGPAENVNWVIAKTLYYATLIIVAMLIGNQILEQLGIDPKQFWESMFADRIGLENAVLAAVQQDAQEMGLTIDLESTRQALHAQSIRELKRAVGKTSEK